jgi:flagellar protein FlaG
MALDVLSGAVYHDTAKNVQKPKAETNVQDSNAMNIRVTELPAAAKTSGNNQSQTGQDKGQKENSASEQQIKEAISKANNKMKGHRTRCEFSYHEETKRVSIKVLDKETQEVIREIPPEETLEMIEKMWELAGLLIDERR